MFEWIRHWRRPAGRKFCYCCSCQYSRCTHTCCGCGPDRP